MSVNQRRCDSGNGRLEGTHRFGYEEAMLAQASRAGETWEPYMDSRAPETVGLSPGCVRPSLQREPLWSTSPSCDGDW
jgi:hypothetical protein